MKASKTSKVGVVVLVLAGIASAAACSSSDGGGGGSQFPFPTAGAAGTPVGGAGAPGTAGAPVGGAGAPSTAGAGQSAGAAGTGTGGTSAAGAAGAAGTPAQGGASGGGGSDITKVVKTAGCGMNPMGNLIPGQTVKLTLDPPAAGTTGTKPTGCADSKCGAWSYQREYFVTLPANYDNTKAYPLVFLGPGCGSNGQAIYGLKPDSNSANNVNNTVIRVGLTPPPNGIGHATNANQGCFDDKEGDDSVDWPFYEAVWDKLASSVCFDKNRVFAGGNSSGAWFANEVGCKYAGDANHPIRGIMPNTGGLPTDARYVPTCTTKPMAGMWIGETMDMENPFSGNVVAINRAIKVNQCTGGDWGTTPTVDYPIGGMKPDSTCKKISGCPAEYPLIVCLITGNQHASHDDTANPGFSTFLKSFSAAPLISQ